MRALVIALLALIGCAAPQNAAPQTGADQAFTLLNPRDYHAFVGNWTPSDQPLCRVIRSGTEWRNNLHPAAVMGNNVFGPPETLFTDHVVLMLAREMPSGDTAGVFIVMSVTRGANETVVDYDYTPPPASTSTMKWYFAAVVDKPVKGPVRFSEHGHTVCEAR